jgi:hypothetical protein
MPVAREAVVVISGQLKQWSRRGDSGREVICLFCADCGTRLFHSPTRNPKIINVKPGTLDDTSWLKPVGQMWTASAQPWVHISEEMLNCERQIEDFSPLFEEYTHQRNSGKS